MVVTFVRYVLKTFFWHFSVLWISFTALLQLFDLLNNADDILRSTLHCFEDGAIEEGALTAFNIALEQFHNAVADRKALLMSLPQNLQRASAQLRATGTL